MKNAKTKHSHKAPEKEIDVIKIFELAIAGKSNSEISALLKIDRHKIGALKKAKEYLGLINDYRQMLLSKMYNSSFRILNVVDEIITEIKNLTEKNITEKKSAVMRIKLSALRTLSYFCSFKNNIEE